MLEVADFSDKATCSMAWTRPAEGKHPRAHVVSLSAAVNIDHRLLFRHTLRELLVAQALNKGRLRGVDDVPHFCFQRMPFLAGAIIWMNLYGDVAGHLKLDSNGRCLQNVGKRFCRLALLCIAKLTGLRMCRLECR